MNTPYLPPVWERDTLGVSAVKVVGFCSSFAVLWAALSLIGGY